MTSKAFSSRYARSRKISSQRTLPARTAWVKTLHFGMGLGNHGDKEPTFGIDRSQVLLCAQLAVGDVDEARMLQQGAQPVPRLQMDPIVGLVPVVRFEVHRHRAIGRDTQAVDQLLEIGAALFAVPPLELNGLWILTVVGTPDRRDFLHVGLVALELREFRALRWLSAFLRPRPIRELESEQRGSEEPGVLILDAPARLFGGHRLAPGFP